MCENLPIQNTRDLASGKMCLSVRELVAGAGGKVVLSRREVCV